MRILFFLQPAIELGNPEFRYTTVVNTIAPQARALRERGHECVIVAGSAVIDRAKHEGKLHSWGTVASINSLHWTGNQNYLDFTERHLLGDFLPGEIDRLRELLVSSLPDSFVPDLIVSWESPAGALAAMFPAAKTLYQTPGFFSRPPFPFLIGVDTGLLSKSTIPLWDGVHSTTLELEKLRALDRSAFEITDTISKTIRRLRSTFDGVALLPLQVDRYFMVDSQNPFGRSQLEFLAHVLSTLPKRLGLVVTNYRSKDIASDTLNIETRQYLSQHFENFVYLTEANAVNNASQAMLPHVDGVITISSSVGVQAAYWQKPLFVSSDNHISPFATARNLGEFSTQVLQRKRIGRDALIERVIAGWNFPAPLIDQDPKRYAMLMEEFNSTGQLPKWLDNFSAESVAIYRREADHVRTSTRGIDLTKHTLISAMPGLNEALQKHDVISFDIFDTLLQRPFQRPTDLFRLIVGKHNDLQQLEMDFPSVRVEAERLAFEEALVNGRQEITIEEIYAKVAEQAGLSPAMADAIKQTEIDLEKALLYPRKSGLGAFRLALALNKRVILISDMYLPKSVLHELLERRGISGYDKFYLSCEMGAKKQSGRLFDLVLADLSVSPDKMLHIGDNEIGDVTRPAERGISTFHLPKAFETYVQQGAFASIWGKDIEKHSDDWRMIVSILGNRLHDNPLVPHRRGTLFSGGPWKLGFAGFGPLLLAYTKWLVETSISDGVSDLFFLARDGKIMKQAYDIVAALYPQAPRSHYLLCSRRAVNLAKISSFPEIIELLRIPFTNNIPLGHLLQHRFGLSRDNDIDTILDSTGWSWIARVRQTDIPALLPVFKGLTSTILEVASQERTAYTAYLRSTGISNAESPAVVDIGYAGTMQESLALITGMKSRISGYYLITFRTALPRIRKLGLRMRGFLGELIDRHDTHHPFCRHIPLYETLFSSTDTSLVRFVAEDDESIPVFMENSDDDAQRVAFVESVHDGAADFLSEAVTTLAPVFTEMDLEPSKSIRTLERFFNSPHERDVKMFAGISFEDYYGGHSRREILPTKPTKVPPPWRQGLEALAKAGTSTSPNTRENTRSTLALREEAEHHAAEPVTLALRKRLAIFIARPFSRGRKLEKLRRNPAKYFGDAKGILGATLRKLYGPSEAERTLK